VGFLFKAAIISLATLDARLQNQYRRLHGIDVHRSLYV
jgi:hypothetical protein